MRNILPTCIAVAVIGSACTKTQPPPISESPPPVLIASNLPPTVAAPKPAPPKPVPKVVIVAPVTKQIVIQSIVADYGFKKCVTSAGTILIANLPQTTVKHFNDMETAKAQLKIVRGVKGEARWEKQNHVMVYRDTEASAKRNLNQITMETEQLATVTVADKFQMYSGMRIWEYRSTP